MITIIVMLSNYILQKIIKYSSLIDSLKICNIIFRDNVFNTIIKNYEYTNICKICDDKNYLSINPCKICSNISCCNCEIFCDNCNDNICKKCSRLCRVCLMHYEDVIYCIKCINYCNFCKNPFCNDCYNYTRTCHTCNKNKLCINCDSCCNVCDNAICEDCCKNVMCNNDDKCYSYVCEECSDNCDNCHKNMCSDCVNECKICCKNICIKCDSTLANTKELCKKCIKKN